MVKKIYIPETYISDNGHISIGQFREMDRVSIEKYQISIELMMENAGLQLARLVTDMIPAPCNILIGAGTGNNGGGGLAAARRLAGWGYLVYLNIPVNRLQPLPQLQLERALAVGVMKKTVNKPDVFIDAYLGFSQRLPLSVDYQNAVETANRLNCPKISLDLPTGFDIQTGSSIFKPDMILTLAAMKTELLPLARYIDIYLADLGLPRDVYTQSGIEQPEEFKVSGLLKCNYSMPAMPDRQYTAHILS
jgi:NAD(P)H-hydrate epimerase